MLEKCSLTQIIHVHVFRGWCTNNMTMHYYIAREDNVNISYIVMPMFMLMSQLVYDHFAPWSFRPQSLRPIIEVTSLHVRN